MVSRRQVIGTFLVFVAVGLHSSVQYRDREFDPDSGLPKDVEPSDVDDEPEDPSDDVKNVRDYGAQGDGRTDDTFAIQAAIDAATQGDTVYLPEGTYSVNHTDNSRAVLRIDGNRHADNLTFEGDGRNTVIELADDIDDSYVILLVTNPKNYSLTLQNLVLDARRSSFDDDFSAGHGLSFYDSEGSGPGNVLVRDLEVRNCGQLGINIQFGGVTLRRVTSHHNFRHGIAVSTNRSGIHDPPPRIQYCHIYQNGRMGTSGRGLNFHGGKGVVEDTVIEGNQGSGATKTSTGAIAFTYRRIRIKNCESPEIYQTTNTPERAHVTFDDFIAENNAGYMRLASGTSNHVPENSELVVTRCGSESPKRGQIFITDGATFKADGDVYSNHAIDQVGINAWNVNDSSYIENYYHYENDRGPIEDPDSIPIGNKEKRNKTNIASVPTTDEVGAWSTR